VSAPRGAVALGLAVAALAAAGLPGVARAGDLPPRPGFEIPLEKAAVSGSVAASEAARLTRGGGRWPPASAHEEARWQLVLGGAAGRDAALLVVFADGPRAGPELEIWVRKKGRRALQRHWRGALPPAGPSAVEVALPRRTVGVEVRVLAPTSEGARLTLRRVRAFRLDAKGRNDAWLFLGASLTVGGIKPPDIERRLRERYPGYRPYVVNEAVSGWTAGRLRRELPAILARHPYARYVPIHIGGNDVSSRRPYPGGAKRLEANLRAILTAIRAAGKVPILARLSFRAYRQKKGRPAVPPEENGSGPYVERIFDPLIREHCPRFFDRRRGIGRVDLYGYYRAHPKEIGRDGVHLTRTGYRSWARLWVELGGAAVYGRKGPR